MRPTLGKMFSKIFSRFTITALLIVIQMVWFGVVLLRLADYNTGINIGFYVIAILMALFIIWRDDKSVYKTAWILLVCMFPVLGSAMYLFFGNKRPARSLKKKIEPVDMRHKSDLVQESLLTDENLDKRLAKTVKYINTHAAYPAWTDTKTTYYPLGDKVFKEYLEDLERAEHFIFMEYFIISEGKLVSTIFEILKKKAAAGVDVRIIFDDVGSIGSLPKNFVDEGRKAGIKMLPFNKMKPVVSMVYNNRDHRKMTIVDGYIGYSGGYNLADEYVNEIELYGHWKDTGIRLYGMAVWNYTVMFLNMWNAFIPSEANYSQFRPEKWHPEPFPSDGVVQPYADSPLDNEDVGENVYLEILSQAEDYVYIFTPYLIIDSEMKTALCLAAKRGVDVRIVTPGIPDKKMILRLTRSYYKVLIDAGVKIYEYAPGFLHAKSYLADDKVGVVGTINMDYRSLFLHFECGTLLIGCECLKDFKEDVEVTISKSKQIGEGDLRRNFFGLLLDSVLRALSPLL